mgnify:CR=1 FL=1
MIKLDNLFDNNFYSSHITLKDICKNENSENQYSTEEYYTIREKLKPYSRKTLLEIQEKNPNLIIFPPDIKNSKDKIHESFLFALENEYESNPEETKVITSNLMGFFGIGNIEVHVHSRFDTNRKDNFLHYMLSKVFFPNVVDLPHSTGHNGSLNLLMFAFPALLNKALSQGIIKEYQTHEYNDPNIKGSIDVQRHIRMNIPFNGKVAYKTREHSYDNFTTELIRHTIEFIKTSEFGSAILESDETTKQSVTTINQITCNYSRNDRNYIISKNLNTKNNPFYAAYLPLKQLCLQILRYEEVSFSGTSDGLYGILFDGAWLWEEYLATILEEIGFTHPRNKDGFGAISVYSGNPRYPDFYKGNQLPKNSDFEMLQNQSEINYVLDAKYKRLNGDDIDEVSAHFSRDDLHQIVTYLHILPAKTGGLIYPLEKSTEKRIVKSKQERTIFGYGGLVSTFGVPIPNVSSYEEFNNSMKEIENNIRLMSFS